MYQSFSQHLLQKVIYIHSIEIDFKNCTWASPKMLYWLKSFLNESPFQKCNTCIQCQVNKEIRGGQNTFYWLNVGIAKRKIQHGFYEPYANIPFEKQKSNMGFVNPMHDVGVLCTYGVPKSKKKHLWCSSESMLNLIARLSNYIGKESKIIWELVERIPL